MEDYRQYAMGVLNETMVSITCILSMIGSTIVIGSYIAWKDFRTTSRNILLCISFCDFFIALGNMCGTFFKPEEKDYKCYAQSFIVSSALISSFLWSVTLAVCLYMSIVKSKALLFKSFLPYLHIFNWCLGLVINTVAQLQGWLGNSADKITAGWCWIKHNNSQSEIPHNELMWMIIDYKGIEIISYASIFIIFLSIKLQLKREVKYQCASSSKLERKSTTLRVAKMADHKLVIIPLLLILARLPGTIRFLIVAVDKMPGKPNPWSLTLLYLQGIGDSAQGFLNCIFFCFLQKKVREKLLDACCRYLNMYCCSKEVSANQVNRTDNWSSTHTNIRTPLLEKDKLVPKYY